MYDGDLKRIGHIWGEVVDETPIHRRWEMECETYAFHPLLHITTFDKKKRSIWYANKEDSEIIAPVTKVLSRHLIPKMSSHTYSSIKGRGLLSMLKNMKTMVRKYADGYYIQTDIMKYYEHIDHMLLIIELRKYVKDEKIIKFVSHRLNDYPINGLPIGLSFASYLGNIFLTDYDRWIENIGIDGIRYMDDMIVFCKTKEQAKRQLADTKSFLQSKHLTVKKSARIAPVKNGIMFCGFKIFSTHILLRKNIREAIKRRHNELERRNVDDITYKRMMAPYFGWVIHSNSLHLFRKTLGERIRLFENNIMKYQRLKEKKTRQNWFQLPKESRISICDLTGKEIIIFESQEVEIYNERKCAFRFAFPDHEDDMHYAITRSSVIMDRLTKDAGECPAIVKVIEKKSADGRKYVCYE